MKKVSIYVKIVFIFICLTFVLSTSFSKDNNKTISKSKKSSSYVKIKDNENSDKNIEKNKNKELDEEDINTKSDETENTENSTSGETEEGTITITEDDIKLENLNSDNELSGLYSTNSLLFNTSIPFKNNKDTLEYYDFYNVSSSNYNIKKSSDVKIYNLDRMYCTGINENSIKESQMIFIENGNVFVSGIFKGKMQKIKILGIKVPDYNKKYRPTHFKEYYLDYNNNTNIKSYFDCLKINGYKTINKKDINNIISYNDYYKRRIVTHLDTILRKHTVFLAFDNIFQDKDNLVAYFYLKNYHCLNKTLIEEGFANLDPNISSNSKTKLYFFDEFLKSQNIAIKTKKGIHFSKKEKIKR